jgi:hypothetical protein
MIIKLSSIFSAQMAGKALASNATKSISSSVKSFGNNALVQASKGAVGLANTVAAPMQATQTAVKSFVPKVTPAMGFIKPGVGQAGFIAKKRGLLG